MIELAIPLTERPLADQYGGDPLFFGGFLRAAQRLVLDARPARDYGGGGVVVLRADAGDDDTADLEGLWLKSFRIGPHEHFEKEVALAHFSLPSVGVRLAVDCFAPHTAVRITVENRDVRAHFVRLRLYGRADP